MTNSVSLQSHSQAGMSLRDELKDATRCEHEALEASLDLTRPDFALQDYRVLLRKYHDFYLAFEVFLGEENRQGSVAALFYRTDRQKAHWLQQDLQSLGREDDVLNSQVLNSPLCSPVLAELFPTAAHLLGAVYVIEGSMLGGRILSRHFSNRLGLTVERGLRFFSGYGEAAALRWQATLQLLEDQDPGEGRRTDILTGAKRMFNLLDRQLSDSHWI